MPLSMTAYARVHASRDWGDLSWEIRSVNHRYLEPGFRLPETLRGLEMPLRELLSKLVRRGKVDCTLQIEPTGGSGDINFNVDLAQKYITAAEAVAELITAPGLISPMNILNQPGVLSDGTIDPGSLETAIIEVFQQAVEELVDARKREGIKLADLVRQRLGKIALHAKTVRAAMPELVEAQKQKLTNKLLELNHQVNPERLEQELVYLAQKADVDEELDRLEVHVAEIYSILDSKQTMGRRLDFLMQELNREANTLSAKSSSSSVTHSAVELKVLIEQIREQIQNLE